jgi:hypothetical protein
MFTVNLNFLFIMGSFGKSKNSLGRVIILKECIFERVVEEWYF